MKIIECPRDAMQGLERFIPTKLKIDYINMLLKVGFDTIDFGSFVSEKVIPQMRDTSDVLRGLKMNQTNTKLLSIVANLRGAEHAVKFPEITYLGYPFSISETFQKRNTNKTLDQSLLILDEIQNKCIVNHKKLVVYLSMAFGNPFNDSWHEDIVASWSEKLVALEIDNIALSDTIGVSDAEKIKTLFTLLSDSFSEVEWGVHLHTDPNSWKEKVQSAYESGCRRFDSVIQGLGGCPMTDDKLVGNLSTEKLLSFCQEAGIPTGINLLSFESAFNKSREVFTL